MADGGRVALIGLGEVGRVFAGGLRGGREIAAWDTAFADPESKASRNAEELGVPVAASAAEAVRGATLVVSAVTAMNCVPALAAAAPGLDGGAFVIDLNSSSPAHKREAASLVEAAGGRYVEVALMSPIHPRLLGSPFLLGGPHATDFADVAPAFGIAAATIASDEIGVAAATKLCRSVIVKGLEALMTESLLAARSYGVEREVLESLGNILPDADWEAVAGYFISRSIQHGGRRAEEMEEAAATVADAGVAPHMALATVERQRWAAQFPQALAGAGTIGMVDELRAASGMAG
jgi:3-hydroxyisobutyrate dehydrogenase-like beta-hydroxyacid dehydrogenase